MVISFTGDVSILLGKADGSFQAPMNVFVGSAPTGIKAGDFNGDGIPDFAVANGTLGQELIYVFWVTATGTFRSGGTVEVGNEPFALVAHDFNHDGKTDLAVANLASNTMSVLVGNGDGTFQPAVSYPAGNGPVSVRAGAFNRPGNTDLAVCTDVSAEVLVYLGHGDGTFREPISVPIGGSCNSPAKGDLNLDGQTDIVTATTDHVVVLLNNGPN